MADGATSLWRSLAGRTKRKRLPHLCSIQAWILATGYDLERCCRCKNQWNMLAGRNKRAPYQSSDYATLHARMAQPVTEASLAIEFNDKELRVLMKHNGMLINDRDQHTGRYSEKTKAAKCKILVDAWPTMIVPPAPSEAKPLSARPKRANLSPITPDLGSAGKGNGQPPCPFCQETPLTKEEEKGATRSRRRRVKLAPRKKKRVGRWWKNLGYNGEPYCQRCSEVVR